jgi:hypothetical protein
VIARGHIDLASVLFHGPTFLAGLFTSRDG